MREATGGCHCGKVHFRVRFADPPELLDCNCSICAKTGFLHLIVDKAGFTLERGADALTDYRWGSGTAQHLFDVFERWRAGETSAVTTMRADRGDTFCAP